MFEQMAGFYNFALVLLALAALWLLMRIFQLLKAIHFMMHKWFERDYIIPFDIKRGAYDGD